MLTNLSKKLLLTLLVVVTSAAGAFSQSGTRVEAQGTDSILFYNNNVKTAALSNTGSFRLGATETFQATALFQLNSASQGFLAPRMTTTDRGNIVAPATGLLIYNTTTNQFDYYDGAAWLSVFSSATGDDGDWTVSGADMYSGVSGNVGIGTSTPGKIAGSSKYFTLSRGDAAGSPTSSDDDVSIELHGGSDAGVGVQSKIEFIARTTSGSDVNTGRIEMTNSSTNTGHGVMRFYTNGGGALLERVTILETGNVGIGTTLPSTPLAILGNGGVQPVGITQNSVGGTATMELTTQDGAGNQATRLKFGGNGNTPDAVFYSGASGAETATVHIEGTNGNVGIGTTAPAYKLDVSGEARIGYMGSPDTIPLVPSDFIIVFGESAMHQFGENWGIGPIQGQGPQHFMAQIPMPVGYKARKVVIKTYRADNNYLGNPHDCLIWNMKNQISQTGAPPFATASVTGDGVSIATFSEIVAHGNSYIGIEVKDIPELPGGPGDPPQEMITGGYVLINPIVP